MSDPGALYTQAITTCLQLANFNSIVTHSNTPFIGVDLLDIIEQTRSFLRIVPPHHPVCNPLQRKNMNNLVVETRKSDRIEPMFQKYQ